MNSMLAVVNKQLLYIVRNNMTHDASFGHTAPEQVSGISESRNKAKIPQGFDATKKAPKEKNALLRLIDFAGSYKAFTVLGCILSGLSGVISIMSLSCMWFIVDALIKVAPHWEQAASAMAWGWWAVGFAVVSVIVYGGGLICCHVAAFRTAANMREAALDHLRNVPLGYFDTHPSGELRRIIDGCASQTEGALAHKLPDFAGAIVTPIAFLVVSFIFDPVMGLVCLIPIIVSFICLYVMMGGTGNKDYGNFMFLYQNALNKMNKAAVEYVRGIPVVKVFQQTVHSFKAFKEAITEYSEMAYEYSRSCMKPQVIQLVAINGTFAVLIPVAILLAYTSSDFASFFTNFLFYVIFSAITTMMMTKIMYSSETLMVAQDSMRRIEEILSVPFLEEVSKGTDQHPKDDSIEFRNVSFSYAGATQKAIANLSLKVNAKTTAALVGTSGGGKTTAASLIPRFWDVDEGQVLIGGVDVKMMRNSELMNKVAFVFQNEHLFKGSLFDNIKAARPDARYVEVEAAAKAAQCDDIIKKMPQGLDTVVGKAGVYLSGGECQRISLARAILKDAPIIVLDEATAFADPENEALIQKALKKLCSGKTVLMIAHRLSTVVQADEIFVLEGGQLVECGKHEKLLAAKGMYSRMWKDYVKSVAWKIESKPSSDVQRGDGHVA